MSWFIGITGRNQSLKDSVRALDLESSLITESESVFMIGGGHPETTFYDEEDNGSSGWIASGVGISNSDEPMLLNKNEWNQHIQKGHKTLHQLNGHFAVVRWNENTVELITDQLGMRNIYIHKGDDFTLFSTRLDWVKRLIPEASINWEKFGSRWLTINQFSNCSFLNGIVRLSQGAYAVIKPNEIQHSNNRWTYSSTEVSTDSFMEALTSFSTLPLKKGRPLSLGLSGGLDSRTLYAVLLQQSDANWCVHTFGETCHPDLETAGALNQYYDKTHHLFYETIPDASTIEELLPDFIGQTIFTAAPSHYFGFQAYQKIQELGLSVIDGGFGEIARRRFMNSVLLRAKKVLLNKDAYALTPYLRLHRADIFTKECNDLMARGMEEELFEEIHAMPEISEIGIENWVDLFSVRTRVPNGAGPEQSRSDSELLNYMPFLQPDLIKLALNLPLHHRKNAQLFRSFIQQHAPKLQNEPLIKGNYTYPYWMKDYSSAIYMRLKQKLGLKYDSSYPVRLLLVLEEYVRDLYHSKSAREYAGYDQKKINSIIIGFYDHGNHNLAHELNWWLAFEIFRRI